AVLKVTDTGSKTVQFSRNESVAVSAPTGKSPSPSFSKVVQVRPGCTITEAAPLSPAVAGVKNLRVAVAADRRSLTLSGDWAIDPKAKGAGGTDVIVPLKLVEERVTAMPPTVTVVTGTIALSGGRCELPLPPAVPGLTREYQIEIRQTAANGQAA